MSLTLPPVRSLLPGLSDWKAVRHAPRRNLVAGLTVALVALPLALAFGVASGAGAEAGMVTAIIAGALAAVFGGSNLQVSGPTGAMTVVLIPVVHKHGLDGVLTVGLMAGVVLVLAAGLRLGRVARYLPAPVIEGFTAGIAVVIMLQQVPNLLGTPGSGEKAWAAAWDALRGWFEHPHWWPLGMALLVAAVMVVGARVRPGLPFSLLAVGVATVVAQAADLPVARIGSLPSGLPGPSAAFLHWDTVSSLIPSALAVAALGALESLLSATVADAMTVGQRHDPDRELFGQGLANLVVPFFGGVPATAAIARTAVNVRAGASSRLAAFTHAFALAAIVYFAATLVGHIPLAALAGVLVATCVQMVEVGSLRAVAASTRGDALVLAATFLVTVWIDLVTAVAIGCGVAVVLALRSVARSARLEQVPLDLSDHSDEEHDLLRRHIVAYRLDGPLFFAAAHRFLLELTEVADVKVVILRLSRLTAIDATGAHVLGDAVTRLERRGIVVLLSGARPAHDEVLQALGVAEHLRSSGRIFADTPEAIAYARDLLHT
jgi:SulP family sulfate permease